MIADLKPYPEYKDSGAPWFGDVPAHWKLLPNRALFTEVNDRGHSDEEMLSVTITKGIIRQKALLTDSIKKDSSRQDKSAYKLVQPNDIAYNKMRAWQGALGVSDLRGIISPAYIVMRLRKGNNVSRYFHYLYRTPNFAKEAERWSYGITSDMWSLRPEHFKMIYTPEPPPEEQEAIVRFLDHANAKIDRYVRAKKKLIKLLNEQKQAIIHRAVTGQRSEVSGQKSDVKMKDSGIPWLGKIPEHWDLRKLKFEMAFRGGGTPSKAVSSYWNGEIPWVSPKDMKIDIISDAEDHITPRAVSESSTNLVASGSILMVVRSGILQRKIPIAICSREVTLNQDMKALMPRGSLTTDYFVLLVRGCEKPLLTEWTKQGATVESIEHQFLANSKVPIPPKDEQSEIVQYVESATYPLNAAITRAEREIELLNEYRTKLTADVVTGKLDVRDLPAATLAAQAGAAKDLPAFAEATAGRPNTEDEAGDPLDDAVLEDEDAELEGVE